MVSLAFLLFCLKLCKLLYLHLWCHMAHLHCATFTLCMCVLYIDQFRFRVPPSLTLHNCFSNHICQICKISEVTFDTSVWSTSTMYRDIIEKYETSGGTMRKTMVKLSHSCGLTGDSLRFLNVNSYFYFIIVSFMRPIHQRTHWIILLGQGIFLFWDFPVANLLYALQTGEWSHSLLKEVFVCYCVLEKSTVRR